MTTPDERFMARAIALARRVPFTSPNPRVGAVVVAGDSIVGEGRHEGAGTPHAEAIALAGRYARDTTLYVNLEPCAHHGRTPPCVEAIVGAGVGRVVAAIEDPDPRVQGRGFAYLRENGVEVVTGVLADEARRVNAGFLKQKTTGRPLVSLKLALSLDGRMAAPDGSARWITGEKARARVHARRREVDAIVTGSGTVVADDPELTVRAVETSRQPVRVVLDGRGRVPATAKVFTGPGEAIVVTTQECSHEAQLAWKEAGAEVVTISSRGSGGVDLSAALAAFGRRGWHEIYVEAGPTLAGALLRDDLVDRLELHYGPVLLGAGGPELGDLGVTSIGDARRFEVVSVERLGEDVVVELER